MCTSRILLQCQSLIRLLSKTGRDPSSHARLHWRSPISRVLPAHFHRLLPNMMRIALLTSKFFTLSQVIPHRLENCDIPPPSSNPPTPTCDTRPPTTVNSSFSSTSYTSPHVAPGPTDTKSCPGASTTLLNSWRSITRSVSPTLLNPGLGICPKVRTANLD